MRVLVPFLYDEKPVKDLYDEKPIKDAIEKFLRCDNILFKSSHHIVNMFIYIRDNDLIELCHLTND